MRQLRTAQAVTRPILDARARLRRQRGDRGTFIAAVIDKGNDHAAASGVNPTLAAWQDEAFPLAVGAASIDSIELTPPMLRVT